MRSGNETRVGVVVLVALALAVAGGIYLRGVGIRPDIYYAQIEGNSSLLVGSEVRLEGVKIGVVQDLTLDESQRPVARLAIARRNPEIKLLKSYQYSVGATGIIGESFLDVRGPYRASALAYRSGDENDPIKVSSSGGFLGVLEDKSAPLIRDFQRTLGNLNQTLRLVNNGVLNQRNQARLVQALDGVTRLTRSATQLTQRAQSSFGPSGVRVGFGDPQAQANLNRTLNNAALASNSARQVVQQASVAAQEATAAAHNLRTLTSGLGGTLNENRVVLNRLLTNLDTASRNVAGLSETLDFTFRQGGFRENSQIAFQSLRRSAENIEATTAGFRAMAGDPQLQTSLHDTLTALHESVASLQATAQAIQGTVGDPAVQGQLRTTLQTLSTTAQTLQATTENLRDTTQGFKNVIGDPAVQNDLRSIPSELRGTLQAARGTLEATQATAERVNRLLGGHTTHSTQTSAPGASPTPGATPSGTPAPQTATSEADERPLFSTDVTLRHLINPPDDDSGHDRDQTGRLYGDINLNADLFGGPARLGLSNLGDGTDLTLQAGRYLGNNAALRYGLYRSHLGIGGELHAGRFSVEGNLWDPNNRSANGYVGFRVTPNITVLAGRENIRNSRTNSIAVRLGR